MRKQFLSIIATCAACLALGAQAQTSAGGSSADQTTGQSSESSRRFGSGARMGHHEVRASKIIGAEVKSGQAQTLGTINDVVFNPASGRIDFAVISLNSTSGSSQSSTSSSTTSATTSSSSAGTSGKLVAVPWMLLRSSSGATGLGSSSTGSSSSTSTGMPTFQFVGDASKLQSAPSFDQSNWPDITQPSWRQSIYAHFGMTPGSSTGGATSPGGTDTSSGSSSSTTTPQSPSSSKPDSSDNSQSKPQ